MIISQYNKSYDTADGTEQQFKDPHRHAGQNDAPIAENGSTKGAGARWDDDGGSLPVPPPLYPAEPASKPTWSVLSLIDLNKAIRLERSPESPLRLQRQTEETERRRLRAIEVEEERMATFAHAQRNRYRNHWENT